MLNCPEGKRMKFEIYFPSKDKDGQHLERVKRQFTMFKITQKILEDFEGYTLIQGIGVSGSITEKVDIITVYTNEVTETYLKVLASIIKTELDQASVMFTINNEAYFV